MEQCDPWPLSPLCLPECWSVHPEDWTGQQRYAVYTAYRLLSKLTGGVYGLCRVTLRPCRQRSCARDFPYLGVPLSASPWMPVLHEGRAYNIACGCVGDCGCGPICEVPLDGPVYDVVSVKVDGVVVDPTSYRVDRTSGGDMLVKQGGPCWPECQDLELPDDEPGTWSVTYRRGAVPAEDGQLALSLLSVEIDKMCSGKPGCVLSERVASVARNGIEIELDTMADVRDGLTGIPYVDRWILAENPYGARRPMRVFSPDTVRGRRTVWPRVAPR